MMINFANYAVRDKDGNLDLEASKEKFGLDIQVYFAKESADQDTVRAALHQIFDQNKGVKAPMSYLTSRVAAILNTNDPKVFSTIAERVETVIQTDSAFKSTKGRNGGTFRVCDQKAAVA